MQRCTSVNGGAFELNKVMDSIRKEIFINNMDYVIINTVKMETVHIIQLKNALENDGLLDMIVWY